jgi:hypothetical protein
MVLLYIAVDFSGTSISASFPREKEEGDSKHPFTPFSCISTISHEKSLLEENLEVTLNLNIYLYFNSLV